MGKASEATAGISSALTGLGPFGIAAGAGLGIASTAYDIIQAKKAKEIFNQQQLQAQAQMAADRSRYQQDYNDAGANRKLSASKVLGANANVLGMLANKGAGAVQTGGDITNALQQGAGINNAVSGVATQQGQQLAAGVGQMASEKNAATGGMLSATNALSDSAEKYRMQIPPEADLIGSASKGLGFALDVYGAGKEGTPETTTPPIDNAPREQLVAPGTAPLPQQGQQDFSMDKYMPDVNSPLTNPLGTPQQPRQMPFRMQGVNNQSPLAEDEERDPNTGRVRKKLGSAGLLQYPYNGTYKPRNVLQDLGIGV